MSEGSGREPLAPSLPSRMNQLQDRIGVVTGASAGIGEAVARTLIAQGGSVVLNARRVERLDALAQELGSDKARTAPGDAAEEGVITTMLNTARDAFGRQADLVVVNAGRGLAGSPMTSDPEQWEEVIRTNVLGATRLIRAAGERMIAAAEGEQWPGKARDIVVIGSTVGRHISPFSSLYGATKFGIHAITEAVRRELGPKGVRVSLVEPGIVASEFQQVAGYDPAGFGQIMERIGPVLVPEDIAEAVLDICRRPAHVHMGDVVVRPTRQEYP